jgi:hypothetical protein
MSAQIIALPKRDRNPHRQHPEVQALIADIRNAPTERAKRTIAKGSYIERGALLERLAAEWGVSIKVTPWQGGGV